MRSQSVVDSALAASDAGVPDAENAARHGVAVKTLRRWRRPYQRRGLPRGQSHTCVPCPRCGAGVLPEPEYAELLGWYLGDGHITEGRRGVWNLHVVNDVLHPDDNARIAMLMRAVKPGGRPHRRTVTGCVLTTVSWKHWTCLFPQHGPGRKHLRRIELQPWQQDVVRREPGRFLRGLFHSDGCRSQNWATREVAGEVKRYDYPRWQFSNRSEDVLGLCAWALNLVDVAWRRSGPWTISVSRRAAVAALDDLIGRKS